MKNAAERMLEDPQPKQCFVCAKFVQNKGKTLCCLLVFTQLLQKEIRNAVFFAQFLIAKRATLHA